MVHPVSPGPESASVSLFIYNILGIVRGRGFNLLNTLIKDYFEIDLKKKVKCKGTHSNK